MNQETLTAPEFIIAMTFLTLGLIFTVILAITADPKDIQPLTDDENE